MEVERPNLEMVELVDRVTGRTEVRQVPDFLPLIRNGRQEGLFPISGMTASEIKKNVPELKLVDDDEDDDDDIFLEVEDDEDDVSPHAGVSGLVTGQHGLGQGVGFQVCFLNILSLFLVQYFLTLFSSRNPLLPPRPHPACLPGCPLPA